MITQITYSTTTYLWYHIPYKKYDLLREKTPHIMRGVHRLEALTFWKTVQHLPKPVASQDAHSSDDSIRPWWDIYTRQIRLASKGWPKARVVQDSRYPRYDVDYDIIGYDIDYDIMTIYHSLYHTILPWAFHCRAHAPTQCNWMSKACLISCMILCWSDITVLSRMIWCMILFMQWTAFNAFICDIILDIINIMISYMISYVTVFMRISYKISYMIS